MNQFFDHVATTNGITVRVSASFLPEQSQVAAGRWFWAYHIRIENEGEEAARLVTRHWRITDGNDRVSLVDGEGIVGEMPRLEPGESHDYVSGCPLETSLGSMEGYYGFVRDDGTKFEAAIPFFPLAAPATAR
ncbi:Co2+/Mg2+ efflux protein ApaG [Croceicoccus gelatinilyticus]|uniref:Co2+/Mg2+ efflux protein ApaG n=1 Tax=Croceicoccus gelatinilyticus TaxID=2835536 RepID=UPI001BCE34B2|nr:Co2+/Mg2+ efflux protein ApaG [Croceicoccus gelatinilyticus]MBS7668304.1 Co2+/Mg2+ efflux protein ApaG [Croceicoccus gelatinilyticus]